MKSLTLAALTFVTLVAAQDLSQLPACATSCAATGIGATGCAVTDAKCVCSHASFLTSVQTCIATACSAADQQKTLEFAESYCLSGGVTITLPTATATTPATSGSAAAATVTSSVAASASEASTAGSAPTSTTVAASTPASATTASTTPTTSPSNGAAVRGVANWVGGLLGLGVGVVAAL